MYYSSQEKGCEMKKYERDSIVFTAVIQSWRQPCVKSIRHFDYALHHVQISFQLKQKDNYWVDVHTTYSVYLTAHHFTTFCKKILLDWNLHNELLLNLTLSLSNVHRSIALLGHLWQTVFEQHESSCFYRLDIATDLCHRCAFQSHIQTPQTEKFLENAR